MAEQHTYSENESKDDDSEKKELYGRDNDVGGKRNKKNPGICSVPTLFYAF
jgi:hypothetical protein